GIARVVERPGARMAPPPAADEGVVLLICLVDVQPPRVEPVVALAFGLVQLDVVAPAGVFVVGDRFAVALPAPALVADPADRALVEEPGTARVRPPRRSRSVQRAGEET